MRINIFVVINQINKHKAKIYNHCMYTQIIIKNFLLFFFTVYKNERKEHKFWQQKYQKSDFYNKNKKIFNIDDIDVNKILVSKKEPYGTKNSFKYFIGYNDNDIIRPLFVKRPQMTSYINKFKDKKNKNNNNNNVSYS